MNRLALIAATLLATAVGASVPALAQGDGHGPRPPMTRADVQAKVQARFAEVDANHDGVVTRAEFDAYRAKMQADRTARRAAHRAEMFSRLDTNKDGQISQAEFAARPDRGPDGQSGETRGDMHGGMRGGGMHHRGGHGGFGRGWAGFGGPNGEQRAAAFFASMDANKDGRITLAEAMAKPLAMFDKADTNHDGTISPEERQAARAAMRAEWQAKRG